ncbi:hypothetical protein PLESTB_001066500 [Pleodorina starrii]|uniref:Phospholipase A-2-activating protein n=1 Tax=Pleodorina starrii TaxID=330485 RepID=A0A9W6BQQ4_9CHLO|nr:hypothetical protein PLESTM_001284300 [Pleodorina starrii]GLC56120.1 hypothetical protein PLESTB_001066500 [Pleodorina starrii]GLC64106.1 hypothetical protein PLESTF_000118700 [Pleodorina starrii]
MGAEEFHLRCELRGHDEDVRGVSVCPLGVLTGSRDKTAKLWVEDCPPPEAGTSSAPPSAGTGGYSLAQTLVGHTDFVGPVLYAPPSALSDYPQGAIVTGSRDKTIRVWDPTTASCLAVLEGHEYQVTALGLLPPGGPGHAEGGAIVSASLDKTLRVWKGGKAVASLTGHTGPVLCLLVLPGGEVLSGSGDTSVKMWGPGGGPCIHTIKAHTDTVRGICQVPGLGFATASHDLSVRVWDSTGNLLAELFGHTAIVYSVAAVEMPPGGPGGGGGGVLLASGSEDNTVRIWRPSGECLQVLEHPGNIWAVDFTPRGDLVTGCSDAVARMWTVRLEARGPPQLREALDEVLAERRAAKEAAAAEGGGGEAGGGGGGGGGGGLPPGLKVEEAFVLSQPGVKDGENKFVRDGATGDVVAYAWDSKSFQWEKLGVVVAGPQGGGGGGGGGGAPAKKLWGGREWDYVFDVDVGEGLPPKKLALDREDNPYLVAQRFIAENELPPYFTEQIVQFILQNTGQGGVKGPSGAEPVDITGGFCDPFTGGAGSGSRPPPRPTGGAAPVSSQPAPITGGGVDPFTGGGGGGSSGAGLPFHSPTHIPCHTLLTFDNVPNLEALGRKIREFNSALSSPQQLSEAELASGGPLDSLLQKLPKVAAAAGGAAGAAAPVPGSGGPLITAADVALLRRLLQWPPDKLFPALDVVRLAALDGGPGGGGELLAAPEAAGDLAAAEPQPGTLAGAMASASSSSLPANHQLALRLAANAAASRAAPLRRWLLSGASPLMDRLAPLLSGPSATKAVRLSGAVLLANLAAAVGLKQLPTGTEAAGDVPLQALSCGLELLGGCASPLDEAEGVYRCLVAIGTLLVAGGPELCQIAKDLDINDRIHAVMTGARGGGATEQKLLQVGIDITAVIARSTGVKIQGA